MKQHYNNSFIKKLSAGFGVIDAMLGLAIMTTAGVSGVKYLQYQQQENMVQSVSTQARQVSDALAGYIKTNYQTLENQINGQGGSPVVLSGTNLINVLTTSGFLPPGFTGTNILGESYIAGIKEYTSAAGTSLTAVLETTGGTPIPDKYVGQAAALLGAQGGFIPSTNFSGAFGLCNGCAQGVGGSWRLANAGHSYGMTDSQLSSGSHLIVYLNYSPQSLMGDTLYRSNVGNPAGNTMSTDLLMNGNNLSNAGTVNTSNITSPNGTISLNGNSIANAGTVNTSNITSPNGTISLNSNAISSAGNIDTASITSPTGTVNANANVNSSGALTATGDTTLWHGVVWTWWQPMAYGAGGNAFYFMPAGWWPAPSYWWTNVPGYSGCGGQNPSGGVNMPWGSFQVWQVGSCNNWWSYVPGGPYGY